MVITAHPDDEAGNFGGCLRLYRDHGPAFVAPRYYGHSAYRSAPTRWDRDGDGIPNRYDRVYNPRWDRDGDGIPNRYDRYDNSRYGRGSRW